MAGHIKALPAELDRLSGGRVELGPWYLAELAAAGVVIPDKTEHRVEVGTDPASIRRAADQLASVGLIGAGSPVDPTGLWRRAALDFMTRGRTGLPGVIVLGLGNDRGPDGNGSNTVELDLWPALSAAGELVLGALLFDRARVQAFAAVATPARIAQDVFDHMMSHGAVAADLFTRGSALVGISRAARLAGVNQQVFDLRINRPEDHFILSERHGLHNRESFLAVDTIVAFLRDRFTAGVSE